MRDAEHQLQKACVTWFRLQYPAAIIYAVPNGGYRHYATAVKLNDEGVTAGVPDLFSPEPRKGFHGLYIEMKVKGNYPTDAQKEMISKLTARGYYVGVCYTLEEFVTLVKNYFNE